MPKHQWSHWWMDHEVPLEIPDSACDAWDGGLGVHTERFGSCFSTRLGPNWFCGSVAEDRGSDSDDFTDVILRVPSSFFSTSSKSGSLSNRGLVEEAFWIVPFWNVPTGLESVDKGSARPWFISVRTTGRERQERQKLLKARDAKEGTTSLDHATESLLWYPFSDLCFIFIFYSLVEQPC